MILYQAKTETKLWRKGMLAVIVENYNSGKMLIFENGFYDGFSNNDLKIFTAKIDTKDNTEYTYNFKGVIHLSDDFEKGRFDIIFERVKSDMLRLKINTLINV